MGDGAGAEGTARRRQTVAKEVHRAGAADGGLDHQGEPTSKVTDHGDATDVGGD